MNPLCAALRKSAEHFWQQAKAVEKSEPELAGALKSLAKSSAKEADEIADKDDVTEQCAKNMASKSRYNRHE